MTVWNFRAAVLVGMLAFAPAARAAPQPSFAGIASRIEDSVVTVAAAVVEKQTISARHRSADKAAPREGGGEDGLPSEDVLQDFMNRKRGQPLRHITSLGSGFVIDPSGLIVTNNHVIEGGDEIYVAFSDGTKLKVDKILGRDLKTDIAVLKVTPKAGKPLHAVSFGDSSRMRVGDWVLAIGNPFDLGGTVTAGILSGKGRDIGAGPYDEFLQTDASINRGNSGGPLFNTRGEVIGINTAIFSPSGGSIGLGFAIPSKVASRVVEQLEHYGEAHWGWIGVHIQSVSDDIAPSLGLKAPEGALVARVMKGGPADIAGLEEGDIILAFGGSAIRHSRQLPRAVAESPVGAEADMEILRGGERKTLKVKVALLNEQRAVAKAAAPSSRPRRRKLSESH